jgi:SAM-dependent methyltransferase
MLSILLEEELVPAIHERLLPLRFQNAHVVLLEAHSSRLVQAVRNLFPLLQQAEATFRYEAHSVDLLIANLMLPWCADIGKMLTEWRRILRPEGVLMLTMLGPDTLLEWPQQAIQPVRMDMHNLGDALVAAGFESPVLDVDYVTLAYREERKCLEEMREAGLWQTEETIPCVRDESGRIPLTMEIIYAHAFCPAVQATAGEVTVPVSSILRRPGVKI